VPPLLLLHFLGFGRGDGAQQAGGAIQGAVGVVGGEGPLVRPSVAHLAQLADQAAFGVGQRVAEMDVPVVPHDDTQGVGIQMGLAVGPIGVAVQAPGGPGEPVAARGSVHIALHKGFEPLA
jgi:hypothetical protein